MKDKNIAAILALFLGGLGVHKFYLGRTGAGVLYLVFSMTLVPWVLGLIDFFVLALQDAAEFDRRYNPPQLPAGMSAGAIAGPHMPAYGYAYPAAPVPPRIGADELGVQLAKLHDLRVSGLLTEVEFQAQKAKLLDRM